MLQITHFCEKFLTSKLSSWNITFLMSALHKTTRYYTQGCDRLLIGTDHKPLLGVLNDRSMDSLDNPRLIRLKEKTLGSRFKIIHIPGRKLCGPDSLS